MFKVNVSLGGDKVSILTHTHSHKCLKKIEVAIYNHQADSPFYLWPIVQSGELQDRKRNIIHVT